MEWYQYVIAGLAAMAAGLVNALAGGGTLISFPALTAIGLPAIAANITNTVALVPGYFGATLAQRKDIVSEMTQLKEKVRGFGHNPRTLEEKIDNYLELLENEEARHSSG